MNKNLKKIAFIPGIIIILGLIGYFLLVAAYCLPTEQMEINVQKSVDIFDDEREYPTIVSGKNSKLDNFTDALMLLTAANPKDENVWDAAVKAERYHMTDKTPVDTIVHIYQDEGEDYKEVGYARYWHGYLVFLKPLLTLFDYGQIRTIIMCAQLALFVAVIIKLSKKKQELVFPFFVLWIFLNPIATMLSMQYNTVLAISFIGTLAIVQLDDRWRAEEIYKWSLCFLVIGALTSYFDLLTYPLVALGIPLVSWIALKMSDSSKRNVCQALQLSVFWGIGYAGMWAFKWILGSVITGENIISSAFAKVAERSSAEVSDVQITFFSVLKEQLSSAYQVTWLFLVFFAILLFVFYIIKSKKIRWNVVCVLAMIAMYPLVWYAVLKNHSYIHQWFTYRELAVSIYAFLVCIMLHKGEKNNGQNCSTNSLL